MCRSTAPGAPSGASRTPRRTQPGTGSTRQCPWPGSSGRPLGVPRALGRREHAVLSPDPDARAVRLATTIAPAAFSRAITVTCAADTRPAKGQWPPKVERIPAVARMSSIMTPTRVAGSATNRRPAPCPPSNALPHHPASGVPTEPSPASCRWLRSRCPPAPPPPRPSRRRIARRPDAGSPS